MKRALLWVFLLPLFACKDKDGDDTGVATDGLLVGSELDGALYSVWGTSADDVWIAGADAGNGPIVLHWDGSDWTTLDTGTTGDLWWVWGDSAGTVWFSGASGRVVRHDVAAGTFEEESVTADGAAVLFGFWGAGPDDLWTVGGDPMTGTGGTILRRTGDTWTEVADLPDEATAGQVFKVCGTGADDVWFVGTGALIMRWDGTSFQVEPPPIYGSTTLLTCSALGSEVTAVGGFGNGVVAYTDGTAWMDASPDPGALAPGFNGVFMHAAHGTWIVGNNGAIYNRTADDFVDHADPPLTIRDYHGTWVDPDGGVWAVGGDLNAQTDGMVAYLGDAQIGEI